MGHPDLSDAGTARGLVIFPAEEPKPQRGVWWLVPAALLVAELLMAIAFAVR
jgi:hypothetical protein